MPLVTPTRPRPRVTGTPEFPWYKRSCAMQLVGEKMPGNAPRLSGSAAVPLERHLIRVGIDRRLGVEQAVERFAVHQVEPHQAGEGKGAGDGVLPGLGEPP